MGFVVYGVHKDGLCDPDGHPFIDEGVVAAAKQALRDEGIELQEEGTVVATKEEARRVLCPMAKDDAIDCLVLFSGTWVWAANLVAAVREFSKTGKGIVIWTHPGSQGWRPVGGLVLTAALKEVGILHKFVYGSAGVCGGVKSVASWCYAAAVKNRVNMSTLMAFGGRGMGQSCGVADPSQWMKLFGIDIDSRDTHELLKTAREVPAAEVGRAYESLNARLTKAVGRSEVNDRSIRLYLALRRLMQTEGFQYYTIQSFPGMGDYYTATCLAQSLMLDDGVPTSTLCDYNTALSAIVLTLLSPERVYYGDLQHLDRATREVKIIGDGAVPLSLADESGVSTAGHGIPTEGSAGGLSINLTCKAGKGVLARFSRTDGRFTAPVARCAVTVPPAEELSMRRHECGIPFWPHAFVTVEGDVDKLMQNWNNEYACLGYGEDLHDRFVDFCALVGVESVPL